MMLIALELIAILVVVIVAVVFERYYTKHLKRKNVTDESLPPPEYADKWLKAKGFVYLSTFSYRRVGDSPVNEWVYTSGEIIAESGVVEKQTPVFFFTLFNDNSVVETGFASGSNIDQPNYSFHFVPGGLEAAYTAHQEKIAQWGRRPVPLRTVDDYERFLALLKTHKHQRQDQTFMRLMGGLLFLLIGAILMYAGEEFPPMLFLSILSIVIGVRLLYGLTKPLNRGRAFTELFDHFVDK